MLPLEECDSLITAYRRMSQTNYPFVILPESCRAASLIEERPMLAQAIFIVTSWRNSARQATLRASFLRDVSDKFLMRSERSLDLLQGLIVYFGWCHFYTITFSSEGYRLATILVTMAIELGITQKPLTVTQHDLLLNSSSIFPQTNEATSSKFWSYEARRAFIAAHIISTFCCLAFRRHSLLPHTQYVEDCASSLATDPQCPSDSLLIYWVKSMALAELVSLTFDHGSRERICELNDDKIQLLVKILVRQLDEWKATLPPPNSTNGHLHRAYHCSRAYIHEVGLYGLVQGQPPSVTRISIIYECFSASMKDLSDILELSLDDMSEWGVMDWRQLNLAVMLCTKSSIILDSTYDCGVESSQRASWLAKCLDTLCQRARELHGMAMTGAGAGASSSPEQDKDHFLKRIANEWSNVKIYHQTCVQRNQPPPQAQAQAQTQPQAQVTMHPNHQAQPPSLQQQGLLQSSDFPFDVDAFNDVYWFGLADAEASSSTFTTTWQM
ncbi:hypothetical protein LTR47_007185 [Exophiala xenobiotica]|nr:hypothetical protein LTR41_002508 [Exophiala xenobiotica]KAK5231782.1 hypothetical protein LTR47_007185 [Exophiala xenobiotica]KAK5248936.1 hypothetical protein LTS06_006121 [Exophiala xenobiotica]KAK5288126.1 hypothetical protein LTR14_008463 [Exophiala xenobiotica]KAK5348188.1 hypothetical protein LTR61_008046 [Exophiala xenobiotica]